MIFTKAKAYNFIKKIIQQQPLVNLIYNQLRYTIFSSANVKKWRLTDQKQNPVSIYKASKEFSLEKKQSHIINY